jgi:hypothetical protein
MWAVVVITAVQNVVPVIFLVWLIFWSDVPIDRTFWWAWRRLCLCTASPTRHGTTTCGSGNTAASATLSRLRTENSMDADFTSPLFARLTAERRRRRGRWWRSPSNGTPSAVTRRPTSSKYGSRTTLRPLLIRATSPASAKPRNCKRRSPESYVRRGC